MKRNYLLLLLSLLSVSSFAQLTVQSGATFFIQSGATVTVQGDVTSNADIQGPGALLMKGSALQTINLNGFSVQNLQIDNAANVSLGGAATVGTSLAFTTGKVSLNGFDLSIGSAGSITGADNTKFIVTNSTGRLVKNALSTTPFTYPVGFDASSYNPTTITQNGTADNIGVRCLQNALTAGATGTPYVKEVVDASWSITEAVAGGSNLSITSTWNAGDELPGFNRAKTGISYFDGTGWDMTNSVVAAATGAGPYSITRSSVSNLGVFAVGGRPVLTQLRVSPKIFLQGAYNGTVLMTDALRSGGLIPTTEPYSSITNFSHVASGGGETIPSGVLAGTSSGSDITDWVFLQLRSSVDGSVITTRSALLQRDGNIVDVDGTNTKVNYVAFAGENPGNYYVTVRHRNHLGVRTAGTLALQRTTSTVHDFTTAQANAFQNGTITTNAAMAQNGSAFLLWAGNINTDDYVRVTSQAFPSIPSDAAFLLATVLGGNSNLTVLTYSIGDANMDGKTRAITQAFPSIPGDIPYILSTVLSGNSNATRREHK